MKRKRNILLFALCLALSVSSVWGCAASAPETTNSQTESEPSSAPQDTGASADQDKGLIPGSTIAGFTVESVEENDFLKADLITFTHEKSGARLAYIRNSDPELAFGIFYNTPTIDETDTNHVFEHGILISSEKYPSSNLFFDLANKSYNSFINAFTYDTFTGYPFSSENEDQFLNMIDVYLSCMAAPGILNNENIFKREALRYELYNPEDPVTMTGTVLSEDFSSLTDTASEAANNVVDALYPGETAANSIGRAHLNYQGLTYEHTIETYERCYHFDNSLMLLYGDMDYERILSFLDQEYLSKAESSGTDLSSYKEQQTEDGHVEAVVPSPAFQGDASENVSQIDYAISLSGEDWEDLLAWSILAQVLNQENGDFMQLLRERGIQNQCSIGINAYCAKPYLCFTLYQAEEEQSQTFRQAVLDGLSAAAAGGVSEDTLRSILKQAKTSAYLTRNTSNVGVNLFPDIANYWTHTGEVDFYGLYETVLENLEEDSEQQIVKSLASNALSAGRTALVTTVPTPGLAEEILAERDEYLAQMKANMSQEEIEALIQETEAFNAWNQQENLNSDFLIDPSQIPDEEVFDDYTKMEENGITFYEIPADIEKAGQYALYFDTSGFSNEDMYYVELLKLLWGELDTARYSAEEVQSMVTEYIYSFAFDNLYPGSEAGKNHHPMMKIEWTGLTEDFQTSLELLLELTGSTDFSDSEKILELIARYKDSYDLSRPSDPLTLALDLAASYSSDSKAYNMTVRGQGFYHFLEDIQNRLSSEEQYEEQLNSRLTEISERLLARTNLIVVYAAPKDELDGIHRAAADILAGLPAPEAQETAFLLPDRVQKLGAVIESSDQNTVLFGLPYNQEDFCGRYVPFITALSDRYLIPQLRFQNGAYSAIATFTAYSGSMYFYSYSDPNAGETTEIMEQAGDYLAEMALTEDDLNGYILNSLASLTYSRGILTQPMLIIENEISGNSPEQAADTINDIKNASLNDQEAAADCISRIIESAGIATVGNETALQEDVSYYDQVISYRSK